MTKSRLIYIGILFVAVAALIWDKAANDMPWLGPASAPAATEEQAGGETTAATDNEWGLSPQVRELINNLARVEDGPSAAWTEQVVDRDLFTPTAAFRQLLYKPDSEAPKRDIHRYAEQLHLSTILIGPGQDYVIINGEVVGAGDAIGPYQIVKIERDAVVVQVENDVIRLNIKDLR